MSSKGGHILSDRRLKKNITDYIGNAKDLIDNIHIVEYEWKNEEEVKQDLIKNKTQNKTYRHNYCKRINITFLTIMCICNYFRLNKESFNKN